jgi:nicotinamidase-related amidase
MSPAPEPPDTALLVMDIQPEMVGRVGEDVLEPIQRAIATARRHAMAVIFVKVGFRPGVVLSTVRAAADLDYRLVVLRDCCADGDSEVHRVLLDKVFPRQAEVIDARRWAEQLRD